MKNKMFCNIKIIKKDTGHIRDILVMCLLFNSLSVTFFFILFCTRFSMEYIIPDAFYFVLYVWHGCVLFIAFSWPTCCPYPLTHRLIQCRLYVGLGCVVFRYGANIVGYFRTVRLSVYWSEISLYLLEIIFILEIICILAGDYPYIDWRLSVYWW